MIVAAAEEAGVEMSDAQADKAAAAFAKSMTVYEWAHRTATAVVAVVTVAIVAGIVAGIVYLVS